MKGAIEAMVAIVITAFLVVVSTAYIMVGLNVKKAQQFHTQVISGVKASDFSPDVVSNLKADAKKNGYEGLKIEVMNAPGGVPYAKVTLDYVYQIPLLKIDMRYDMVGYAKGGEKS